MIHDEQALSPAQIDAWLQQAYRPNADLPTQLRTLALSLMHRWPLCGLRWQALDLPELRLQRVGGAIDVTTVAATHESMPGDRPPEALDGAGDVARRAGPASGPKDVAPLCYANEPIGQLQLDWQAGLGASPLEAAARAHLCGRLARLIHRDRVARQAPAGRTVAEALTGVSASVLQLEQWIERAAGCELPVMLHGEFGTETGWVAEAIHRGSRRRVGPWVAVFCAHATDDPGTWLGRAEGGTLFLQGVDELPAPLQRELLGECMARRDRAASSLSMRSSSSSAANPGMPMPANSRPVDRPPGALDVLHEIRGVRLIASTTTARPQEENSAGPVMRGLRALLEVLTIELPPLRHRRSDLRGLIDAALDRLDATGCIRFEAPLVQACEAHDWPDNLCELDRTVAQLALLADGPIVGLDDAARHAPWLLNPSRERGVGRVDQVLDGDPQDPSILAMGAWPAGFAATAEPATGAMLSSAQRWPGGDEEPHPFGLAGGPLRPLGLSNGSGPTAAPRSAAHWVRIVLERQHRILDTLHAGLRRALLFLSDHYAEPVTLTELSEQAHVSASHLTFLFRSSLGMSFKSFLLNLRIHTAQQLLRESPLRITEVAMRAGFADLSHFERCFRRAVGQSARDYRRGLAGRSASTDPELP